MFWIFVGILASSLVVSSHDTREACEGRAVIAKEKGVNGKCVDMTANVLLSTGTVGTWQAVTPGPR